jgi:hypothetical protein
MTDSLRVYISQEIFVGMLRNLACHAKPEKVMVETEGFVSMVVKQFFVNDAPSLSKACRCQNLSRTLNVRT